MADYAGGTGVIFAFMGSHREPAKHLVKEMLQHKAEFSRWGGMTYCATTDPNNAELLQLGNIDIAPLSTNEKDPRSRRGPKPQNLPVRISLGGFRE